MSTTEDFRGYGVGEQILNHLMKWFAEKNVVRVQLHATENSVEFYLQHGFEKDSYTNMWWKAPDKS
jgi:predicted GNAT family N-acyltransferase